MTKTFCESLKILVPVCDSDDHANAVNDRQRSVINK